MAPGTRSQRQQSQSQNAKASKKEIIVVDSDDSDADRSPDRRAPDAKRQKMNIPIEIVDEDVAMPDAPPTPPASVAASSAAKNGHLKGRKRFQADFADIKAQGLECAGMAISKFRAGDDEGSMDIVIVDRANGDKRVLACNVMVTDTSEYPKHHALLTWSEDADSLPPRVSAALAALDTAKATPIGDALERLLLALAPPGSYHPSTPHPSSTANTNSHNINTAGNKGKSPIKRTFTAHSDSEDGEGEEDEDEGSDAGYDAYFPDDDDVGVRGGGVGERERERVVGRVQRDFLEIVSSSYRPGLIPLSAAHATGAAWADNTDFCLSVSLPTVALTSTIPAQALVAWDRRLLASPRARHLVLLISGLAAGAYPPLAPDGTYVGARMALGAGPGAGAGGKELKFRVGVCGRYKPARSAALEAGRLFGLLGKDAEDEVREAREREAREREERAAWGEGVLEDEVLGELDAHPSAVSVSFGFGDEEGEGDGEGEEGFERFSLSSALEALMDAQLVKLIWIRRTYGVGWAGAELMQAAVEREQRAYGEVWKVWRAEILAADKAESALARLGKLPHDPLRELPKGEDINLPYTAFCYLVRRLTLCTRYCLVCHNRLTAEFEALKPYVCDSPLCTYQYYAHNRGASLEYEIIHNPETVDLLVSLTYSAAAEGVIDEPLPVGMALRVPPPDKARIVAPPPVNAWAAQIHAQPAPAAPVNVTYQVGTDGLVDFDSLPIEHMRASIAAMIDTLPAIDDMKRHLERKVKPGKSKPRLQEMENGTIIPAAWYILRWCVASCTAYLEEMSSSENQRIQGVDSAWRQFRFSVGAPDAEAKFQKALKSATETDANAKKYPSLYAFHGSALRNWHSIVRHGLWYKTVVNGRAFGDGVYLAKEAQTSMGHYAAGGRACWRKSKLGPTSCVALAEVVNLPAQFVSSNPHFVIKDTTWIMCRYLLVKGLELPSGDAAAAVKTRTGGIPFVKLDPAQAITLQNKQLQVPQPGYQIAELVQQRQAELVEEDFDVTDQYIFEFAERAAPAPAPVEVIELTDDDGPMPAPVAGPSKGKGKGSSFVSAVSSALKGKGSSSGSSAPKGPPKDDWKHDAAYVQRTVDLLMPPPIDSSPSATMAVQRELKTMLKEQEKAMKSAGGLKELGWYMPPEVMGDNLFQWIVEMHSFDETLPIAKDMKRERVNSLIFEIRFPPTYPIGPPFFRIITPRFLPFIQGGGGHVTGGGSICMDLLTSDGWLPSYSIPAVLMQIKLAISNLDPKPARLAPNWNTPYAVGEALAGFKRAAATHGWTVPDGIDKLVR
ncbi:hypothetical protein DFH07DRAFT_868677 [Mycena maculata]|uniref:UBC core domain-containing protein n=1 Tax=Mycena maculata TaxID=230809 RepID=A0AAD7NBC6_9AGAR|nr:hypothetical protein DFH07DRAFT_868677 [Mycena maculata]